MHGYFRLKNKYEYSVSRSANPKKDERVLNKQLAVLQENGYRS